MVNKAKLLEFFSYTVEKGVSKTQGKKMLELIYFQQPNQPPANDHCQKGPKDTALSKAFKSIDPGQSASSEEFCVFYPLECQGNCKN